MDGFFSFLGKVTVILLVIILLVGIGYYVGTGKLPFPSNPPPAAVTTTAPETTITLTLTPTIAAQKVTMGNATGTSFHGYSVNVPESWTVKKEETASVSSRLTISRGNYAIAIYQAATGGAECLYPGESGGEMSTTFGPYVTIHDAAGTEYRRATATTSTSGFTVCQKSASGFGLPTTYGHVTYVSPPKPDSAILGEMDAIFSTLAPL